MLKRAARGQRVQQLERMPVLLPELQCFWYVFSCLHSRRQSQMSAVPLSVGDIVEYLRLHVPEERHTEYYAHVTVLDDVWITHQAEKRDAERSKAKAKAAANR